MSGSALSGFSAGSFYTGVVLVLSSYIRPAFLFGTWRGWVYDCTQPDAIIKLIEAVYMKRHEEDLIGEEECYRMLTEIIRSPELFKAICGSSLKGSCDPNRDKLKPEELRKINLLEKMERKGFDVEKLKSAIIKEEL